MGCNVFVEKPMAESVEECDRMIEKARDHDLVLSVNHSDRFDPVVLQALDYVQAGKCGKLIAVHSIRSSDYPPYAGGPMPRHYKDGSYPFRDLGVHGLYLLESFLGPIEELKVDYHASGRDAMLTFDEWRAQARCERGTGYLFLSLNSRPLQSELWIQGTQGTIHVDRFLQVCEMSRLLPGLKQFGLLWQGLAVGIKRSYRVPLNVLRLATGRLKRSPGIYQSVQEFHRALAEMRAPPVSVAEGRRVVAWLSSAAIQADLDKQARVAAELSSPTPQARILVTGGSGFLGSALVRRLRQTGEPVRLLLRSKPEEGSAADPLAPGGPVSIVYGSLGDPEVVQRAVEGVEIVYHLGAATKGGIADFEQATIWGTRNIIDACVAHHVRRLVYVSSLSVLDHASHGIGKVVTEGSRYELKPELRGAYSRTKLEAERMVLAAIRDRGLSAVLLRPGQVLGPGAERVPPAGVFQIGHRWIVAGKGNHPLPIVHREDTVTALLLAATGEGLAGQIFNLVDGRPMSQNDYLQWCGPALASVRVYRIPVWILMVAATMVEALSKLLKRDPPLSRHRVRSLRPLWPFDNTAATERLGWNPAENSGAELSALSETPLRRSGAAAG
jgi:nucleoside-diphosphate-sugar epimerase/predicted dehydrogenase